ncbi:MULTISPECIES: hypothetical protein [unclassified Pseudomonas]|uniref:hypothetical protein n=1 Tax=unclassified Pseudomonas TaxID=196821 RepID=UPI002AC8E9ED|nr:MULTISPECIES: hypothetical protein [unclassified Pseudomonas]MEB0040068.1 hypothetical protein [Pseudomonas sp. MH10]MEB0122323.1 hypothetical protein [Pseudomonas sp. CCI1.2]WPX65411.1 hypothetical protein RHM59_07070 [Pseudomonas sp. MH10]
MINEVLRRSEVALIYLRSSSTDAMGFYGINNFQRLLTGSDLTDGDLHPVRPVPSLLPPPDRETHPLLKRFFLPTASSCPDSHGLVGL